MPPPKGGKTAAAQEENIVLRFYIYNHGARRWLQIFLGTTFFLQEARKYFILTLTFIQE
jgi:hypothetical protein